LRVEIGEGRRLWRDAEVSEAKERIVKGALTLEEVGNVDREARGGSDMVGEQLRVGNAESEEVCTAVEEQRWSNLVA
jgi:hypothetical protein